MTELRPCYAFMGNTLRQQFNKICEEVEELRAALDDYEADPDNVEKFGHMVEEAGDVQFSTETFNAIAGLDTEGRDAVRAMIYAKDDKRGYFKKRAE
ncbi:MAG: hypothetical protein K6E80_07410 [Schwartzia sp.]|nr:hypothetical protein [Schwartzia sp. (in: firmicutes)]